MHNVIIFVLVYPSLSACERRSCRSRLSDWLHTGSIQFDKSGRKRQWRRYANGKTLEQNASNIKHTNINVFRKECLKLYVTIIHYNDVNRKNTLLKHFSSNKVERVSTHVRFWTTMWNGATSDFTPILPIGPGCFNLYICIYVWHKQPLMFFLQGLLKTMCDNNRLQWRQQKEDLSYLPCRVLWGHRGRRRLHSEPLQWVAWKRM